MNLDRRGTILLRSRNGAGTVSKIRLLGDWQHATRIAFVEFVNAESAKLALGCSGALLGTYLTHILKHGHHAI